MEVSQRKAIAVSVIGILLLVAIIVVIVVTVKKGNDTDDDVTKTDSAWKYTSAAVASDSEICSKVGADILRKNGTAADSAIATLFCLGVVNLHSCGIGGGAFLVIYKRAEKKFTVFDIREEAPESAHEDMFVNKTGLSKYGGLSVAVPGLVSGLSSLYKEHGRLNWSVLVQPSIDIAEKGFKVTKPVATAIESYANNPHISKGLKKLITKPDGKTYLRKGDLLVNKELAATLKIIAKDAESFYTGDLAKRVVNDVNFAGGNMSLSDLKKYSVKKRKVLKLQLPRGDVLNTMSAPGGGPVLAMIHNIMTGYNLPKYDLNNINDQVNYYHQLVESMKFAYAQRGLLGDPDFVPEKNMTEIYKIVTDPKVGKTIRDKKLWMNQTHQPSYYGGFWGENDFGTSHLSILSENGDAVATTTTINYVFGSLVRSLDTGIIYNNEMDDFSTPGTSNLYGYPPSPANYIRAGKRPLSSMSPSIVTDKNGDVKMIAGASGGSKIISGTAQVLLGKLFLGQTLGKAVENFRIHHQGIPNNITINSNNGPSQELIDRLKGLGHTFVTRKAMMSVVQAIYKDNENIYAVSDPRKHGKPDGF